VERDSVELGWRVAVLETSSPKLDGVSLPPIGDLRDAQTSAAASDSLGKVEEFDFRSQTRSIVGAALCP
jgi:hypothetical protein